MGWEGIIEESSLQNSLIHCLGSGWIRFFVQTVLRSKFTENNVKIKSIIFPFLERDLIGLREERVCLFKAEADIEDEINIPARLLRNVPRFTCHTNLQDAHLYLINKWLLDECLSER